MLLITLALMLIAAPLMRVVGVTGSNVANRLFGVVLGALSVQFVLDGLRSSLKKRAPLSVGGRRAPARHDQPLTPPFERVVVRCGERGTNAPWETILELRAGIQHLQQMLRVGSPVRRKLQHPAGAEPLGDALSEGRLDQAALVMTLLRPGIRKQDEHFGE